MHTMGIHDALILPKVQLQLQVQVQLQVVSLIRCTPVIHNLCIYISAYQYIYPWQVL